MNFKERKHTRINLLYTKAKTGKYSWNQLEQIAINMGVKKPTAKEYLLEVEMMLKKAGYLKDE